jgi:ribonuclease G
MPSCTREAGGILDDFSDIFPTAEGELGAPGPLASDIGDLLRLGQEVLVQVVKDPLGTKGARLTTHVTLPGRFLVYLPTVRQRGVSRRITDPDGRARLKAIIDGFPGNHGWIVRTAGEDRGQSELEADRDYLQRLWGRIQGVCERSRAPSLTHHELSPVLRTVRDTFTQAIQELWVDDEESFQETLDFLEQCEPALIPRVKLFRKTSDLMAAFGIDRELEKALRAKVWLKSGGYLVVNQTEALVAIDVNTGKFVGSTSLEETAFAINLEAVREIVRQLRLRDIGGIIVIDFIDMLNRPPRRSTRPRELAADRAPSCCHERHRARQLTRANPAEPGRT